MKKLMCALAAVAAGVALADVQSANIVGYQKVAIANQDFSLFAPTFKGVGGELDLTDIKVFDAVGEPAFYGAVTIQTMDEYNTFDGETCEMYTWDGEVWLDSEDIPVDPETKFFRVGDAFLVVNSAEDVFFQVSGEVDLINKNLIPNQDFSLNGNSLPVPVDLANIKVVDADGEPSFYGAVTIQTMDENNTFDGETCEMYTWDGEVWLDGEDVPVDPEVKIFNPGDAFLVVNSAGDELYLQFPSPIAPKAE